MDGDGHFKIESMPPGDYKLFAFDDIQPYAYFDADFIREVEDKGLAVHVSESTSLTLQVRHMGTGTSQTLP